MKGDNKRINISMDAHNSRHHDNGRLYFALPERTSAWVDIEDINRDEQGHYIIATETPVYKLYWNGGYEQTWNY